MDPIAVKDEDYQPFFDLQKGAQLARLEGKQDDVERLQSELTTLIHKLYPESEGKRVRFDVSGRKIFFW